MRLRRLARAGLALCGLALAVSVQAAVAATFVGGAGSGTPSLIRLKIGDAIDVVGTRIACFAITSDKKDGIACVLWGKNSPLVGGYGIGLAVDGTAVVNRIKADGTSERLFKRRLPAARDAASGKTYRVRVGEGFGLPAAGDAILGCQVLNVTSTAVEPIYRGVKVSCWFATATRAVPNTYGVSISDKFAGVFKVTPQGKLSSWGFVRRQPK